MEPVVLLLFFFQLSAKLLRHLEVGFGHLFCFGELLVYFLQLVLQFKALRVAGRELLPEIGVHSAQLGEFGSHVGVFDAEDIHFLRQGVHFLALFVQLSLQVQVIRFSLAQLFLEFSVVLMELIYLTLLVVLFLFARLFLRRQLGIQIIHLLFHSNHGLTCAGSGAAQQFELLFKIEDGLLGFLEAARQLGDLFVQFLFRVFKLGFSGK